MPEKQIRVLVVDDDADFCLLQKRNIDAQEDMVCCGVAPDGKAGIALMHERRPDVVVLDHVMPILDGLGVLEYVQEHPLPGSPRFLVISASRQEHIVQEMMARGADYFLEKPFDAETLLRRIRFVYGLHGNGMRPCSAEYADRAITEMLLALGVPVGRIGFGYMQRAVAMLLDNERVRPTFKQIYTRIAEECGSDSRCVENAISSALKAVFELRTPALRELLAFSQQDAAESVPTGRFLTMTAQYVRLEKL